jgi:hypothetical protein
MTTEAVKVVTRNVARLQHSSETDPLVLAMSESESDPGPTKKHGHGESVQRAERHATPFRCASRTRGLQANHEIATDHRQCEQEENGCQLDRERRAPRRPGTKQAKRVGSICAMDSTGSQRANGAVRQASRSWTIGSWLTCIHCEGHHRHRA